MSMLPHYKILPTRSEEWYEIVELIEEQEIDPYLPHTEVGRTLIYSFDDFPKISELLDHPKARVLLIALLEEALFMGLESNGAEEVYLYEEEVASVFKEVEEALHKNLDAKMFILHASRLANAVEMEYV